jgi:DNA-binding transcriptional LysR family regulator
VPWDLRLKRRLKLRDLDTLLAVAQYGSMAKAAARLSVSQPAISKAIADMEATIGVRLFDRTAQGVEPTMYGRALLKSGVAIFDDLRQGVEEIGFLTDPASGELRIGTTEPMTAWVLPTIIDRLSRQYPRMVFHISQIPAVAMQYDALRERRTELTIGRVPGHAVDDDLQVDVLFHERLHVVVGRQSPWARRRRVELVDLVDQCWALPPPDTLAGGLMADVFRASGLNIPRASVLAVSIQLQRSLLATGRFVSMFPTSILQLEECRTLLKVLSIKLPQRPWPVATIRLKNRTVSPVAQLFMNCAREVAKPLTRISLGTDAHA